jgi:hypothetical protein
MGFSGAESSSLLDPTSDVIGMSSFGTGSTLVGMEAVELFGSTYVTVLVACSPCFVAHDFPTPLSVFQRSRSTFEIKSEGSVTFISKDEAATVAAEARLPNDPNHMSGSDRYNQIKLNADMMAGVSGMYEV